MFDEQLTLTVEKADDLHALIGLKDEAHPGLHSKPLNDDIGRLSAPYRPGGRHYQRIQIKYTNTNKTQLLASNYGTFGSLVVNENFGTRNGPSTQLIDVTVTSFV